MFVFFLLNYLEADGKLTLEPAPTKNLTIKNPKKNTFELIYFSPPRVFLDKGSDIGGNYHSIIWNR